MWVLTKIHVLTKLFEENRNADNAGPMQNYMKGHFSFLGIKSPLSVREGDKYLN
jgi:hypothetical protein